MVGNVEMCIAIWNMLAFSLLGGNFWIFLEDFFGGKFCGEFFWNKFFHLNFLRQPCQLILFLLHKKGELKYKRVFWNHPIESAIKGSQKPSTNNDEECKISISSPPNQFSIKLNRLSLYRNFPAQKKKRKENSWQKFKNT